MPPTRASEVIEQAAAMTDRGRGDVAASLLRDCLRDDDLPAGQAADVRLALAKTLLEVGRPKSAVAELVRVLRVDAHRPDALLVLVEGLTACGEFDRAQDILERARQSGADPKKLDAAAVRLSTGAEPTEVDPEAVERAMRASGVIPPFEAETEDLPREQAMAALAAAQDDSDAPEEWDRLFDDDEFTWLWDRSGAAISDTPEPRAPRRRDSSVMLLDSDEMSPMPSVEDIDDPLDDDLAATAEVASPVSRPDPAEPAPKKGWSVGAPGRSQPRLMAEAMQRHEEDDTATDSFPELESKHLLQGTGINLARIDESSADESVDEDPTRPSQMPPPDADPLVSDARVRLAGQGPRLSEFDDEPPLPGADNVSRRGAGRVSSREITHLAEGYLQIVEDDEPSTTVERQVPVAALDVSRQGFEHRPKTEPPAALVDESGPTTPRPAQPARRSSRQVPGPRQPLPRKPPRPRHSRERSPSGASEPDDLLFEEDPPTRQQTPLPRPEPDPPTKRAAKLPSSEQLPAYAVTPPPEILGVPAPEPRPELADSQRTTQPKKPRVAAKNRARHGQQKGSSSRVRKSSKDLRAQVPSPPKTSSAASATRVVIVGLVLAVIGLFSLVLFVVYPWIHASHVRSTIDAPRQQAEALAALDTWRGLQDAAGLYQRALQDTQPAPAPSGAIVDRYLVGLGFDSHEQQRLAALTRLAEIEALMGWRYGDEGALRRAEASAAGLEGSGVRSPRLVAARAIIALANGDRDAATTLLEEELPRYDKDPMLHYLRGRIYDETGQRAFAIRHFEQALDNEPKFVPAHVALGRVFARRGDARALEHFKIVLSDLSPDHVGAAVERSLYLIGVGKDMGEARSDLEKYVSGEVEDIATTDLARCHYAYGLYKRRKGANTDAEAQFRLAMEQGPDSVDPALALVELLLDEGRLDEVEKVLADLEERFDDPQVPRLRANLLLRRSRASDALGELAKTMDDDAQAHALRGHIHIERGDLAKAEAAFDRAVRLDSRLVGTEVDAWLDAVRAARGREDALRRVRSRLDKTESAANHYRLGRALLPRDPKTALQHFQVATKLDEKGSFRFGFPPAADVCRALFAQGSYKAATDNCNESLKVRPDYLPGRLLLGEIALQQGNNRAATNVFEDALKSFPRSRRAREHLTRAQIVLGEIRQARDNIDKLLAADANRLEVQLLQGLVEFRTHRYSRALGYFKRAAEIAPKNPEVLFYLGVSSMRVGQTQAAYKPLVAILEDPRWRGPAHIAAGEYRRRKGDWRRAVANTEKGMRLTREDGLAEYWTVVGLTELGLDLVLKHDWRHPAPAATFKRAAEIDSLHGESMYYWARIALEEDNEAAHLSRLKKAVDRDPNYCPAVKRLREIKQSKGLKFEVPDTCM